MRRSTDTLIALQFLAVVVPIAFVLVAQLIADQHRAAALEYSRPLRNLADEARANYRTFTNGAAEAVDAAAQALGGPDAITTLNLATERGNSGADAAKAVRERFSQHYPTFQVEQVTRFGEDVLVIPNDVAQTL